MSRQIKDPQNEGFGLTTAKLVRAHGNALLPHCKQTQINTANINGHRFSKPCALNQAGEERKGLDISLLCMRLFHFTLLYQTVRILNISAPHLTEKNK